MNYTQLHVYTIDEHHNVRVADFVRLCDVAPVTTSRHCSGLCHKVRLDHHARVSGETHFLVASIPIGGRFLQANHPLVQNLRVLRASPPGENDPHSVATSRYGTTLPSARSCSSSFCSTSHFAQSFQTSRTHSCRSIRNLNPWVFSPRGNAWNGSSINCRYWPINPIVISRWS